tara:strand:+ start:614 stop:985 length:372 start_codon:yes stop_codon:yes gene_type:complete
VATKNATLNAKAFKRDMKKLQKYINGRFADEVLKDFKKETPVDTGYGVNHTKKKVTKNKSVAIFATAKYKDYIEVLDDGLFPNPPKEGTGKTRGGYSTQAKKGMSKPTVKNAEKRLDKFVRGL